MFQGKWDIILPRQGNSHETGQNRKDLIPQNLPNPPSGIDTALIQINLEIFKYLLIFLAFFVFT
jgi:hypothetical protein